MPRVIGVPPVKLYYRIGEVAELVGVEPHVLRYWETEFPTIRPQKSRSGQRVYSRRDVEKLLRVKDLLYGQRFTIAGARQRLRGGDATVDLLKSAESPGRGECVSPEVLNPSVSLEVASAAARTLRGTLLAVRVQVVAMMETLDEGGRQNE